MGATATADLRPRSSACNSIILFERFGQLLGFCIFIWSNQASGSAGSGVKLDPATANTNYTSPNYFMTLASEHMNAKISPYLQFLSAVRADLPAVERLVLGAGGFADDTSTTYLDGNGNPIRRRSLSKEQKQLLKEYRLVQYDMTAGKNYLADDTTFFDVK